MSELRHDPVQKRWVIIASERGKRPADFDSRSTAPANGDACPFCPGAEPAATPYEIWRWQNGRDDWQVRVVPNRFPVLAVEGDLGRAAHGHYDRLNGVGAHEIIIESPDHHASMATMPAGELVGVLLAWRERLRDLHRDHRLRYVTIFKNHGRDAGATLAHPHSQLIATPITPRTVAVELQSCREHYAIKERCLFCDILAQELSEQQRIVTVDEKYVTMCPYASKFPFEMHLFPRRHAHDFSHLTDDQLHALARHLRDVLRRMSVALGDPAFNLMLHTAPNPHAGHVRPSSWQTLDADWHWHIEILPRLLRVAGFEWGTGFYINPTAPEEAAEFLRGVRR